MKRALSLVLVICFLISGIPFRARSASAAEPAGDALLMVEDAYCKVGNTVYVNVYIENNPGIAGMTLSLTYDEDKATLISVESGEALSYMSFTAPKDLKSGCRLPWATESVDEESVKDGVAAVLEFKIADNAEVNDKVYVSLSYNNGAIVDNNLGPVSPIIVSGCIDVLDYTPGDLNDNDIVDTTDVVYLMRFIAGGYDVTINEAAADVNNDGNTDTTDCVYILRYIAGGYTGPDGKPLRLKPSEPKCDHSLTAFAAKDATCTEDGNIAYWYCELCQKYFSDESGSTETTLAGTVIDALGHNIVTVPGYDATKESTGLTDGKACDRSGCDYVEIAQEVIPVVTGYKITYEIANGEDYIEKNTPVIPADKRQYFSDIGIELPQPQVAGYRFIGWSYSQASSDNVITEIPAGTTGDKTLYGHWQAIEYTVTFDSPDIPFENITYTVDSGATLKNPSCFGYTFVGWSDDNGFIVSRIKPGTTGNITLHANWTSDRNKATSYQSYGAPIIIEDDKSGQILFVYNIGKIDNVPLNEVEFIGKTETLNYKKKVDVTDTVNETYVDNINKMISEATTKSSGWTLSKEWEDIYSTQEETGNLSEKSDERTTAEGKVVGGKYFVSNSEGGSTYSSTESGGSSSNSSKVTTENSVGINASYDHTTEKYCDAKLGVSNVTEASAGIELPVKIAKVSAGVKNTTTVEAEVKNGRKDTDSFHIDGSISGYVGTVDLNESSSYYNSFLSDSSSWNSTNSYEQSSETSREDSVTNAIKEQISQTTTHNLSKALGQANTNTAEKQEQHMSAEEYSTSFTYNKGTQSTVTKLLEFNSSEAGYYRIITAGTVHVYGVVGYDVATASYYTYCFNVLDDTTREILDYSKDNMNFNDCENGVVTFEIPFEINEYVAGFVGKTDGLEISYDGVVTDFEATENFDGTVVVPQYEAKNNQDGTFSAVKVTSFATSAFAGKENIETVVLPIYITHIPDGAFAGCKNLKTVIAYGVTSIGANAFSGCENLSKFYVDNAITFLGANAFEGVTEVAVTAYNAAVADAAISCGAKKISVNISYIKDTYENKVITVDFDTLYFALIGNGGNYNNIRIDSAAKETLISNMVFANNSDTPLKLASEKVTLARVKVENSPSFALVLTADNSELALLGTVSLNSAVENTVLSKNVTLKTADHNTTSKLVLNGGYLVYGSVTNTSYLNVTPTAITEGAYNGYLLPSVVTFNANGGSVGQNSKVVYKEHTYGTLPTPEKQHFAFKGWYTTAEGGTLITADTKVNTDKDHTLYAHWEAVTATVHFDANGGNVDQATKTFYIGQPYGTLPTPTKPYNTFKGWYTAADGGSQVTSDTIVEINTNQTLYAHWEIMTAIINFNANGGSVSTASQIVNLGERIGILPVPTRDYYTFTGWYTAASGGERITADGAVLTSGSFTLYAQWALNPLSDWVPASSVPSGAQTVENKWTYTRTQTTESTDSSMSGWTQTGSYWKQTGSGSANYATFPAGYDENHTYYKTFERAAYSAYDDGSTKREVTNTWAGYVYWHWMYDTSANGTATRAIYHKRGTGPDNGYVYQYFFAFTSTRGDYSSDRGYCNSQGITNYIVNDQKTSNAECGGATRWFRFDYYLSSYVDYQKIYQYEKVTTGNESATQVTAGGEISNVQHLVRYRTK